MYTYSIPQFLMGLISLVYTYHPISSSESNEIINHTYYHLEYSEEHEQSLWVFYGINRDMIGGTAKRKNNFKEDKMVSTGSASLADYKGSGYDRGHLCPAGDMKLDQHAMDETFFMANMSPQAPSFNRGKWRELEEQVRKWIKQDDMIFVATGPVLDSIIGTIGENEVSIPANYYKVIYSPPNKMIGFIMPNRKITDDISNYSVSVDSVEIRTNLDFFSHLEDSVENKLEKLDTWH